MHRLCTESEGQDANKVAELEFRNGEKAFIATNGLGISRGFNQLYSTGGSAAAGLLVVKSTDFLFAQLYHKQLRIQSLIAERI